MSDEKRPIEPLTRGIPPAQTGALAVLQHTPAGFDVGEVYAEVSMAALRVASPGPDVGQRGEPSVRERNDRHASIEVAVSGFLRNIVQHSPPGPQRSTAISRALEAGFWSHHAIEMEGL